MQQFKQFNVCFQFIFLGLFQKLIICTSVDVLKSVLKSVYFFFFFLSLVFIFHIYKTALILEGFNFSLHNLLLFKQLDNTLLPFRASM